MIYKFHITYCDECDDYEEEGLLAASSWEEAIHVIVDLFGDYLVAINGLEPLDCMLDRADLDSIKWDFKGQFPLPDGVRRNIFQKI